METTTNGIILWVPVRAMKKSRATRAIKRNKYYVVVRAVETPPEVYGWVVSVVKNITSAKKLWVELRAMEKQRAAWAFKRPLTEITTM